MKLRCSLEFVVLVFGLSFSAQAMTTRFESIPIPGTRAFPESITSKSDGTLYVGRLGDGGIVRINPHTHENAIFVQPGALGSRSILGVFADEASNTLWACSNDLSALGAPAKGSDTGSALKAFDLRCNAPGSCPPIFSRYFPVSFSGWRRVCGVSPRQSL